MWLRENLGGNYEVCRGSGEAEPKLFRIRRRPFVVKSNPFMAEIRSNGTSRGLEPFGMQRGRWQNPPVIFYIIFLRSRNYYILGYPPNRRAEYPLLIENMALALTCGDLAVSVPPPTVGLYLYREEAPIYAPSES